MEPENVRIFDRVLPVGARPAVCAADFWFCAKLPLFIAVSLLPEKFWYPICYLIEHLKNLRESKKSRLCIEKIRMGLSLNASSSRPREIKVNADTGRTEHSLQIFREYGPGGWRPLIIVEGVDNLERSIAKGKGVILWVGHFAFASLATKKALAARGYRVSHLSRPEHGFSKSKFGVKWLNPIRCSVENRYLERRVLIQRSVHGSAYGTALGILRDGGVISITAGAWEGRTLAEGEFLAAKLQLAIGAPKLAYESGGDVLPVFTVREPATRTFVTTIGKPLSFPKGIGSELAIPSAVNDYLKNLATHVLRYPDQWRGWDKLI